jgi:hypothetical protein
MILLNKGYDGYLSGTIVQLQTSVEAALVAQGLASVSAGPVTPGPVNAGNQLAGRVGIAAGGISIVVTAASVTTETKVNAVIAQAAADSAALYVARIVPGAGFFTAYLNAAANAAITLDWSITNPSGMTPKN